ncbi:SAG family member [Eimeria mitis]|uniref:SAG family member n=1 Tax=Eimeria mitis TaxID=44415 RepID=U6KDM8_9EIME|nr:SAG family member [Eimeria mitis]CDJ36140.1 SAG family member [Eimeria mitis]
MTMNLLKKPQHILYHSASRQILHAGQCFSPLYVQSNDAVCLAEINVARAAAKLAEFVAATAGTEKWPKTNAEQSDEQSSPWYPVCEALIAKEEPIVTAEEAGSDTFPSGTYAFMALDTAEADCAAAVSHWKDAASNFTAIPPSKTKGKELYEKQHNVSFIAMYNPSENASVDCRVVTCTQTTTNAPAVPSSRNGGDEKKGYALLCMTTPDAFEDSKVPFSEEQWNKIKASLTGSATAVAPSLLVFAIAALGLAAL